jgi:hypothetical protein
VAQVVPVTAHEGVVTQAAASCTHPASHYPQPVPKLRGSQQVGLQRREQHPCAGERLTGRDDGRQHPCHKGLAATCSCHRSRYLYAASRKQRCNGHLAAGHSNRLHCRSASAMTSCHATPDRDTAWVCGSVVALRLSRNNSSSHGGFRRARCQLLHLMFLQHRAQLLASALVPECSGCVALWKD